MLTCQVITLFAVVVGLGSGSSSPVTYSDRKCGNDLGSLWLDVVLVIDNSRAVTNIDKVTKSVLNVFGNDTRIGTRNDEPKTTRVGMVLYNQDAKVIANLNRYQSIVDLNNSLSMSLFNLSSSDESSLLKGLETAENVLDKSLKSGERQNYKKVFIIYTPVLQGVLTSIPMADRLKADGVTIITVDVSESKTSSRGLEEVATRNYDFKIEDEDLTGKIQDALLQTNCFCPNTWTQLRASHSNRHSYRYGTCLSLNTLPAVWRAARLSCRNQWKNAYLANEYDANKHEYVLEMMQNKTTTRQPYTYHIGLSYSAGAWYWEQPAGQPLKKVEWNNWNTGFPTVSSTLTVGMNVQTRITEGVVETKWQNTAPMGAAEYYVCEVATCDTDNYCDTMDY